MTRVWVHWVLGPGAPEAHDQALAWMSAEERQRHDRFAFEAPKAEFRLARWLVHRALARHAGHPPEAWAFAVGPQGKPEVAAPQAACGWRFNLSHAPGVVAVALAEGVELGLDAEDAARPGDFDGMAPRCFAPSELAALRALPSQAERHERFFELWTLKEAYLKARGVGLGIALDSFAFDFVAPGEVAFAGPVGMGWRHARHRPTPRHLLP